MKVVAALKGALAYLRFPRARDSWGGPFNGQECRQAIFEELQKTFNFSLAIETGTYRGTTTGHLAKKNFDVITVEIDDYYYGYAMLRFLLEPRVKIYRGDSRTILNRILDENLKPDRNSFFYLDAHWREYLPLKDEVSMIFERVSEAVVMVDDFQVPDDPGYGFDDYGEGKVLNLDYLDDAVDRFNLSVFFPVCRSDQETGARRGCVILARDSMAERVRQLATLGEYRS